MFCSCVRLFFFFKQKTAYEMRISDWSSDVCSSDLPFIVYVISAASQALRDAGLDDMSEEERLRAGCSIGSGIGGLPGIESESLVQIGRASCRERVCQYV